jgi:hypothetical protein
MLNKIYNSFYVKKIALLLVVSMLGMSFQMHANGEVVLNAGTMVPLETTSKILSNRVMVGQMIDFKVRSDVKVGDQVVIASGSIAKGQVVRAKKAKGLGKEGFLEVQVKSVTASDGQEVFLAGGNISQEGDDKQTEAVLLGVLVCILFLTIKGQDAIIPSGYQVNATVAVSATIKN